MKTIVDEMYKCIKGIIKKDITNFSDDQLINYKELSEIVKKANIGKAEINDLDNEIQFGSIYLAYLVQKNHDINLGLCEDYKIWNNRNGTRMCCSEKKGNAYICKGNENNCNNGR